MATIKVSQDNNLLYETYANGEASIKSLVSAIRTVQKESNEYLTKLVEEEKISNNNTGKKSGRDNGEGEEEEGEDGESDADEGDKRAEKKEETGKRRNSGKSSPNAKKYCSVR